MSIEEIGKSIWDVVISFWDGFVVFILKFMSISAFLGLMLAHLEQLVVKKESIVSVFISYIGSFIVVFFAHPLIDHFFGGTPSYGMATLAIGYFAKFIIKYITNKQRINAWLKGIEKFIIEWLKSKLKK